VNQRMHAAPVVRGVLEPLLQKYKALLPRDKWLTVCMQCMRLGQATVDALRDLPEQRDRAVNGGEKWQNTDQVCVIFACMASSALSRVTVVVLSWTQYVFSAAERFLNNHV
jgi:hypothetical protein